jgi:haloalkane dehalogenase
MERPFQIDKTEYPFNDNWFAYRDGYIHYADEGKGPAVLLLHGNPTWSYIYRNVIKELRGECRLIALDLPGFGMSQAPTGYGFTAQEHAKALTEFISRLELKNFVLVVQDWGGPIGISYAVNHPANIRGIIVMNTWAWPASLPQWLFSIVMGGWPLGYWLQTRKNYFAASMLPDGFYNKQKVTEALKAAYTAPFPTPESRIPTWVFPRQIRKARRWLAETESKLSALAAIPAKILWGNYEDPGFGPKEMKKWQDYLKLHETETLEDAGHSVQEDRPDKVAASIRRILERTTG